MAIFITKDSKVIVQGITGGEGTKHSTKMLAAAPVMPGLLIAFAWCAPVRWRVRLGQVALDRGHPGGQPGRGGIPGQSPDRMARRGQRPGHFRAGVTGRPRHQDHVRYLSDDFAGPKSSE